jgi:hypothetical protein
MDYLAIKDEKGCSLFQFGKVKSRVVSRSIDFVPAKD